MSIHDKGMIAHLNISTWTARKFDPKVTKAIEDTYYANNSGRYNKILIASESMASIQKIVSAARSYHYENTLPWLDNGGRLLPTANYFAYAKAMDSYYNKFMAEVRKFLATYPDYVEEARQRLNGMFCSDDYPNVSSLDEKFKLSIQMSPIPDDFRVNLNDSEVESIREEYRNQLAQTTKNANLELWKRLHSVIDHMLEKLSDTDARFKNSLVENVAKLCDLMPRLNVTADSDLADMVAEVRHKLALLEPEELRKNPEARSKAASEAQRIMEKLQHYMPAA